MRERHSFDTGVCNQGGLWVLKSTEITSSVLENSIFSNKNEHMGH